jgi:hypothetical protein
MTNLAQTKFNVDIKVIILGNIITEDNKIIQGASREAEVFLKWMLQSRTSVSVTHPV